MSIDRPILLNLMQQADEFALVNPKKAGNNLRQADVFIIDAANEGCVHALHWLLYAKSMNGDFVGPKGSNNSIQNLMPQFLDAGYILVEEDGETFEDCWEKLCTACTEIGELYGEKSLSPSNRTDRPNWSGRYFFVHEETLNADHQLDLQALSVQAEGETNDFQHQIEVASALSSKERRNRFPPPNTKPKPYFKVIKAYRRSEFVISECLHAAQGRCDKCHSEAPFIRKSNKTPFLEVHHITPLSEGGDDSLENVEALCPNCHRQKHFGINS